MITSLPLLRNMGENTEKARREQDDFCHISACPCKFGKY